MLVAVPAHPVPAALSGGRQCPVCSAVSVVAIREPLPTPRGPGDAAGLLHGTPGLRARVLSEATV